MPTSHHQRITLGAVACLLVLVSLLVGRPASTGATRAPDVSAPDGPMIELSAADGHAIELSAAENLGAAPRAPQALTPIFDTRTGASLSTTSVTPRTFMGQPFNLASASAITAIDFFMGSTAAASYTNIQLRFQLWDSFSGTTPVFASPVGPVAVVNLGAFTTEANRTYQIRITFDSPIALTGTDNHGITVNYRGDTGTGLADTNNLTSALRGGATAPAFAVGSVPVSPPNYGYLRNASGRTDFNFDLTDLRHAGANSAMAIILYTTTPDTTTTPTIQPSATATAVPPTATAVPPTATAVPPTATATTSPTASPAVTATAIASEYEVYLPVVMR